MHKFVYAKQFTVRRQKIVRCAFKGQCKQFIGKKEWSTMQGHCVAIKQF